MHTQGNEIRRDFMPYLKRTHASYGYMFEQFVTLFKVNLPEELVKKLRAIIFVMVRTFHFGLENFSK